MTTTELPHPALDGSREATPAPRSMADAPLPAYESHSSISVYRGCPLRYGFRYVERRPARSARGSSPSGTPSTRHSRHSGCAHPRPRRGHSRPGREVLQGALDAKLARSGLAPDEVEDARRRAVPVLPLPRARGRDGGRAGRGRAGLRRGRRAPGRRQRPSPAPSASSATSTAWTGPPTARPRSSTTRPAAPAAQADVDADAQLTAYAFGCARGGLRDPATRETLPPASRLGLYFAESGALAWTTRPTSSSPRSRPASSRPSAASAPARSLPGRPPGAAAGASTAASARRSARKPDAGPRPVPAGRDARVKADEVPSPRR